MNLDYIKMIITRCLNDTDDLLYIHADDVRHIIVVTFKSTKWYQFKKRMNIKKCINNIWNAKPAGIGLLASYSINCKIKMPHGTIEA